jgi:acyl-CoA thioester hydrolase
VPRQVLPPIDDVTALPTRVGGSVEADFIDVNGHMNVRYYLGLAAAGASAWCEQVGIDDAYRRQRRLGVFTSEHHIRYFSEMHEGGRFSVHVAAVDKSEKVVQLASMLVDLDNRVLACCVEIILVHVDMDSRRPGPLPQDIVTRIDSEIAATSALGWSLPLSGAIGIRR